MTIDFDEKINESHEKQYMKSTMTLDDHPKIEGYDFEQGLDFKKFLKAYSTVGFQATHLTEGIEIVKAMQREKAKIFLSFTSNQISSGNREIIKYLVKNKKVDVLVTSAGSIEEDIIKALKPFVIGKFDAPGAMLFEHGINRTGNIFVPNDRFAYYDIFMQKFMKRIYKIQKEEGKIFYPKEFIRELGLEIDNEDSVLYWAAKNDIPVFCPGIIDGAVGDMILFFKQANPDFLMDVSKEILEMVRVVLSSEKTGAIVLGGGISKHFTLMTNIFKEGLDYAVYINTAQEFDGSDSGARIDEAITWGKIKAKAPNVKIHCDATIAFPLLVAGSFIKDTEEEQV